MSSISHHDKYSPHKLYIDPDEPDWDYSMDITKGVDDRFELQDLQAFEGELYNSIVVEDDDDEPLTMPHSACTDAVLCLREEEDEDPASTSLFYQTYRELSTPKRRGGRPKPIGATALFCGTPKRMSANEKSSTTTDATHISTAQQYKHSPLQDSLVKTRKTNETSTPIKLKTKKPKPTNKTKTTNLHLSTIPPPSCSLATTLLLLNDADSVWEESTFPTSTVTSSDNNKQRLSPTTSITDIFADLEQLERKRGQSITTSTTTSVTSTLLGSLDTATILENNDKERDASPYYPQEEGVEECKEEEETVVLDEDTTTPDTTTTNQLNVLAASDNKDKYSVVVNNSGRAVFHWEIVKEQQESCFPSVRACPLTAAEF